MDEFFIYGAGQFGTYFFDNVEGKRIIGWIDNFKHCVIYKGLPVYSENEFIEKYRKSRENIVIILAISNSKISQDVVVSLIKSGFKNIKLLNKNLVEAQGEVIDKKTGEFSGYVIDYEKRKPTLSYLETQVADSCNLNCAGCMHLSNLVTKRKNTDFNEFIESLERLSNLFENIKIIRLMGGEPLLNPRLNDFVVECRKAFPKSDIRVVTNGLLLTSLSEELIDSMKKSGASFDITQYPPTRAKMSEILSKLDGVGVDYSVTEPIKKFEIRMSNGESNPDEVFKDCEYKTCNFLRNRRLYVCPNIPMLYENKAYFEFEISEEEIYSSSIDFFDKDISGWKIIERLSESFSLCRFCSICPQAIDWNNSKPTKFDWIST